MTDAQRNFLILGLIAVAGVLFSGAFGAGAGTLSALLSLAFTVVTVWFLINLYHRHSGTIAQMGVVPRLVLQISGIVLLITLVIGMTPPVVPVVGLLLPFPIGYSTFGGSWTFVFWGGVFGSGFGIWWAWQQRTSGW